MLYLTVIHKHAMLGHRIQFVIIRRAIHFIQRVLDGEWLPRVLAPDIIDPAEDDIVASHVDTHVNLIGHQGDWVLNKM